LSAKSSLVDVKTNVVASDDGLRKVNPAGKIPTLLLDDGTALHDSSVICQYLDSLHAKEALYPMGGARRWAVLRTESLCDSMCDAAVSAQYEKALRPEQYFWDEWLNSQILKVTTSIAALEMDSTIFETQLNAAQIAAACALAYVDFRHGDLDWRKGSPALADWLAEFSQRPSMQASKPLEES
jgi:glutathione S-transferase